MGGVGAVNGVVGECQDECRVIDTRHVASTRRLVFLGLEREGVHVDTNGGDVGVVLVGLHQVEVFAFTFRETIVAVELDLTSDNGIVASHTFNAGDGVAGFEDGAVKPVGVVEGLLAFPGVDGGIIAGEERVALDDPHEFLARVVEVQLDLVGGRCD